MKLPPWSADVMLWLVGASVGLAAHAASGTAPQQSIHGALPWDVLLICAFCGLAGGMFAVVASLHSDSRSDVPPSDTRRLLWRAIYDLLGGFLVGMLAAPLGEYFRLTPLVTGGIAIGLSMGGGRAAEWVIGVGRLVVYRTLPRAPKPPPAPPAP